MDEIMEEIVEVPPPPPLRHKLFADREASMQFAEVVQQYVNANINEARLRLLVTGNIKIIPAWIEWMQRYSVPLVIEPVGMDETDVVDDINQPVVEMEGL